jgi:hypothetical protein
MRDQVLLAAVALVRRHFATHWLRHRSKAPIAEGWSTAPVADVSTLLQSYRPGYNLGVRCGHWSSPAPGCGLVIIDTDIKVPAYSLEALDALTDLLGPLDGPAVASGRRNGSRHDWRACPLDRLPPKAAIVVRKASTTWTPPGKEKPEPVWHIEILSSGKHPVTGYRYEWITPSDHLPLLPKSVHDAIDEALSASVRQSSHDARAPWTGQGHGSGQRPGDEFNQWADWHAILFPHGWVPVSRRGDIVYWRLLAPTGEDRGAERHHKLRE